MEFDNGRPRQLTLEDDDDPANFSSDESELNRNGIKHKLKNLGEESGRLDSSYRSGRNHNVPNKANVTAKILISERDYNSSFQASKILYSPN